MIKQLPAGWAVGGIMCLCLLIGKLAVQAQEDGSLSTQDIEFAETRLTLQTMADENKTLRRQLEHSRETIRALTQSVALANEEAEVFRRMSSDLQLRMEALGIDALNADRGKLEQRLLSSVRDLQLENEEKLQLRDRLASLTEAVIQFLQDAETTNPQAHLALETEIRAANEALGYSKAEAAVAVKPDLTDGMVVSIKEDLSLVVMNLGEEQGVKIGMPFEVWRGNDPIGMVTVIDVRKKIAGAVIQQLRSDKEKINVGDRLRVDTR